MTNLKGIENQSSDTKIDVIRVDRNHHQSKKGKIRVLRKERKLGFEERNRSLDRALHPLHAIRLQTPKLKVVISRILTENFQSFNNTNRKVLGPIYRLLKTPVSEFNRCSTKNKDKNKEKNKKQNNNKLELMACSMT